MHGPSMPLLPPTQGVPNQPSALQQQSTAPPFPTSTLGRTGAAGPSLAPVREHLAAPSPPWTPPALLTPHSLKACWGGRGGSSSQEGLRCVSLQHFGWNTLSLALTLPAHPSPPQPLRARQKSGARALLCAFAVSLSCSGRGVCVCGMGRVLSHSPPPPFPCVVLGRGMSVVCRGVRLVARAAPIKL